MTNTNYDLNLPWLAADDTHDVKCCLCRGKNPTEDRFSFKINGKEFKIKRCMADDLMFLYPQPGEKYAETLYNHPSYYEGTDDMYGLALTGEKSSQIAEIRVQEILKYKPDAKSILEIGCGYGHILVEAKNNGFKIAEGTEVSQKAIEICKSKGLQVYNKIPKGKKYSVAAMFSVLEHVDNPLEFLKEVKELVDQSSVLVIRVPNMNPSGPWLSLVDHTWHFTKNSIRNLLLQLNLAVTDIFPSGKFLGIQHPGALESMTVIAKLQ